MAKRKLTAVPSYKPTVRRPGRAPKGTAKPEAPDLSNITPALRDKAMPLADLAFLVGNPLNHPEAQLVELAASLRTFGQVEPLIVNVRSSPPVVIGGNGRLAAMLRLNWTHAAVVEVDLLEFEANTLAVTLNASRDRAEWDEAGLRAILDTVQTSDQDLATMFARLAEQEGIVPVEPATPKEPTPTAMTTCPACGHQW